MKTRFPILAAAFVFVATGVQTACAYPLSDVSVINRTTGERLKTYRHKGQLWVAGKPGERYAIELRNRTDARVMTVVAVDGINVISGETASANQQGYVLSPGSRAEIAGWRKSDQEVASFYFTALPDSYAARTDRPADVGVIGVAVFREYQEPKSVLQEAPMGLLKKEARSDKLAANRSAAESSVLEAAPAAPQPTAKLGTGLGERVYAPTWQVEFRKASSAPEEIVTIRYDSYQNLVAAGIVPVARRPQTNPRAFPADGYVPDPS